MEFIHASLHMRRTNTDACGKWQLVINPESCVKIEEKY